MLSFSFLELNIIGVRINGLIFLSNLIHRFNSVSVYGSIRVTKPNIFPVSAGGSFPSARTNFILDLMIFSLFMLRKSYSPLFECLFCVATKHNLFLWKIVWANPQWSTIFTYCNKMLLSINFYFNLFQKGIGFHSFICIFLRDWYAAWD